MRRFFGLAAMAAVLCLTCPVLAAVPIKGATVKGGHNPGGSCAKLPCRTNNSDERSSRIKVKASTLQPGYKSNTTGGGSIAGNGVTQEHAINTKGTGGVQDPPPKKKE